jgi:diadenosine tetraphosphatase ApaH/serine/threonine PP2A family protein phosphatase
MMGRSLDEGHRMRYLVLSDIHSNLEAFRAVLDDAGPVDAVWCLGDVVGYGPDPNACVELLRSRDHICIAGNHDWATLGKLDLRDFNPDAREANLWNHKQLTPDNLAYLDALPETLVRGKFTLAHGSPRHPIWEYIIYPSTAEVSFQHFDTPYCLAGHTHTPIIFRLSDSNDKVEAEALPPALDAAMPLGDQRLIINPGSVGQPRDGDPRASYALLDDEALTIEHRRVAYPLEETQAKMMEHGLPLRLVLRLGYGW